MNWDKLNKRLQEDAAEQQEAVDIDSIWNAIEPQVDELNKQKRKRRGAFLFWWGFGIVLLCIVGWVGWSWILGNDSHPQVIENQTLIEDKIVDTNIKSQGAATTILKSPHENNEENKTINSSTNNSNFSASQIKLPTDGISQKAKNNSNQNFQNSNSEQTSFFLGNENSQNQTIKSDLSTSIISENKNVTTQKTIHLQNTTTKKITISEIPVWRGFVFSENEKSLDTIKGEYFFVGKNKKESSEKDESKFKFTAEIYGGINFTQRKLTAKNNLENELLQIRNTYETPLETSQLGLQIGLSLPKNFSIFTGIQATQISERYEYNNTITKDSFIEGVQFLSIGLSQDTFEIMGEVKQTNIKEYQKRIFNTYRLLDIPILVGYHRNFGERWEMGIQGGIFANFSLKTKGIIPNVNLEDVIIQDQRPALFKSKVGLSYQLGVSVKRKINKYLSIKFSPNVRYFPNDFASTNNTISQQYFLWGGNVGVVLTPDP